MGKVRHLRTQGLWVQETRVSGRLKYKKVLGSKNPADVLTKYVSADLLNRHLESIRAKVVDGRAEAAPELNSVESWVEWFESKPEKTVRFDRVVHYRAVPKENRGKRCDGRRAVAARWPEPRRSTSSSRTPGQWADWTDEEDEQRQREADGSHAMRKNAIQ